MIVNAWMKKAKNHIDVCEILLSVNGYDEIINQCYLSMYSVVKALLHLKNINCKTHDGLIYLFKTYYVDNGLFDEDLFKFFCKTKELNSKFLSIDVKDLNQEIVFETLENTKKFTDYSCEKIKG